MIAFSFDNKAASASLVVGASTTFTDAAHPATNVQIFGRPNLRAYSADTSAQRITWDFGATTSLDVFALIHPNFTGATIQGNAADTWGAPGYNPAAITMARSTNDRYHHAHRPTVAVPFSRRYASLSVPNQATTDGATFFKVGPIWAGLLVLPPQEILFQLDEEKLKAIKDLQTADGRDATRLVFDDPAYQITATRRAYSEAELAAWREIDRLWDAAPGQAALVCLRPSNPEEAYVMRQVSVSKWQRRGGYMESELTLREVVRG